MAMGIKAEDCRLDGFSDGIERYWLRATHFPTGIVVDCLETGAAGAAGKRRLMEKLQEAVNQAGSHGQGAQEEK